MRLTAKLQMGISPELVGARSSAHSALPHPPQPPRFFCPSASTHLSSRHPPLCFGLSAFDRRRHNWKEGRKFAGETLLLIYLELREFFFFLVCIKRLTRCKESVCPGWNVTVTVLMKSLSSIFCCELTDCKTKIPTLQIRPVAFWI